MKWHSLHIAALALCVLFPAFTTPGYADTSTDRIAIATEFITQLTNGEFTRAVERFDPKMKDVAPADSIQKVWNTLIEQCGPFLGTGATSPANENGFDAILVTCRFQKATLTASVVFDNKLQINGLWFRPYSDPAAPKYSAPSYVNPANFSEQEMTVGSGEWKLPATLSIPKGKGPFPAVVLVHGSGAQDRDETIGPNKPFRDIAQGLASQGIAVLRYEKRTKAHGVQMAKEGVKITVKEEVTDDVLLAVKLLRITKRINPKKVFVLGHSLGGMLVPRIGKADPQISGLISLAGPSRPLEDLVIEQVTYLASLDGKPSPEAQKKLDEIKADVAKIKALRANTSLPDGLLINAPATYWLDLNQYKQVEVAKSLKLPMLFIQGGRDYQVTRADLDGWMAALKGRKTATFKYYPQLNHLMQDGVGKSKPSEYDQRKPVNQQVLGDIANWVKQH
ncbi:MAG: alpha/beta hydrolase [Armatimonadota bacterium]